MSLVAERAARETPLARVARTRIAMFASWLSGLLDAR